MRLAIVAVLHASAKAGRAAYIRLPEVEADGADHLCGVSTRQNSATVGARASQGKLPQGRDVFYRTRRRAQLLLVDHSRVPAREEHGRHGEAQRGRAGHKGEVGWRCK